MRRIGVGQIILLTVLVGLLILTVLGCVGVERHQRRRDGQARLDRTWSRDLLLAPDRVRPHGLDVL